MVNNMIGFVVFALFISMLDRYFSGENYKKSEWINGTTIKAKFGLSVIIAFAPYLFSGFFYSQILYTPFYVIGMVSGLYLGEFFLKSYDWAFKPQSSNKSAEIDSKIDSKSGAAEAIESGVKAELVDKAADMVKKAIGADETAAIEEKTPENNSDSNAGGSQKTVIDAITHAGGEIKEGLKNLGEGIAKASENVLKKDGKEPEKKEYKPNEKLNGKLKDY